MSGPEKQRTENCPTLQISLTEKCPATSKYMCTTLYFLFNMLILLINTDDNKELLKFRLPFT